MNLAERNIRWNVGREDGGSALLTAGCHALDALLMCMGGEVESVSSLSTRSRSEVFAPYQYDTSAVTTLRFKHGAVGKCAAIVDCFQPYYFHTHLVGSEGSLLDDRFHSNLEHGDSRQQWKQLPYRPVDSGDVSDHPYLEQFNAFFAALARGEEMPLTGLADSRDASRRV